MFSSQDPVQQQGLLAAAAALMQAGAPSRTPISTMQGIIGAQQAYHQTQQAVEDRQRQQALYDVKIKGLQGDLADKDQARQQQRDFEQAARDAYRMPEQQALAGGGGPTLANATKIPQMQGGFDTEAFLSKGMGIDPLRTLELAQKLKKSGTEYDTKPQIGVDANGQTFQYLVGKNGEVKRLDGVLPQQDPNKPFTVGPDGRPVANTAYQQYEIGKAKAGATNVTTKVENKAAESIASQVGPMLKSSADQAQGALGQIDASNRILQALKTGKLYTGPLASQRLSVAQLGQTLGIGGADDAEKIANTRQLVRGLAEMTLQGRKQMQGQGQITEQESRLAEKATSGDIDSMTADELRIVALASQRAAKHTVASHQAKLAKARGNPATAGIADYFDAPALPSTFQDSAPPAPTPKSQFSAVLPDGRTISFKDAKSLANFKLEAGIR